ncbi:MAG: hypothetical protein JWM11_6432, partial [Planctomycetaceae bacterium]|nr:hypothetical protein [Planctomycetaceae bacterium]
TMQHLFPGNPLENLGGYVRFHEASFLVDVQRWPISEDPELRELGLRWQAMLCREFLWRMACERTFYFTAGMNEQTTIFSEPDLVMKRLRQQLPATIRDIPLKIDVARHYHRPGRRVASGGQNFVYDPAETEPRELAEYELFRSLPLSFSIVRCYAQSHDHDAAITRALQSVLGAVSDAKTNM